MMFFQIFTLTLTFIIIPLLIKLHFLSSNLHSHSHDICFVKTFPAVMLQTLRFKSSVLFGPHTLLDRPSRVSQLPKHLSKLTAN